MTVFILCTASCTKEGPVGPQGATGVTGATGPQGLAGQVNITTFTFNVSSSQWILGTNSYFYNYPTSSITSAVNDRGVVLCYLESDAFGWLGMPWIEYPSTTYQRQYNFTYSTGNIQVQTKDSDNVHVRPTSNTRYKVVVIPAGGIIEGIDYNNYNAVVKAYNLSTL